LYEYCATGPPSNRDSVCVKEHRAPTAGPSLSRTNCLRCPYSSSAEVEGAVVVVVDVVVVAAATGFSVTMAKPSSPDPVRGLSGILCIGRDLSVRS
jgi:hypothetical protein